MTNKEKIYKIYVEMCRLDPELKTEDEAWKYARELYEKEIDEYGYIEYGIREV